MKCGRDKDATLKCPAYPNFGRVCWVVAERSAKAKYRELCTEIRGLQKMRFLSDVKKTERVNSAGDQSSLPLYE
jgi:hypothetical protein